ncbi:MAG TPA: hypothetical protein PLL06_12605, partial [Acidobacteriota bacterium]|nr:hypothetical protein [Acidobacteriota bacterium]
MKRILYCILTIWLLVGSTLVFAQEALTNESIVKLVKAGLGDELIVNMINTQPGNYRVTPDDILGLKEQGISEKILGAMINKGVAPAPNKPGGSEGTVALSNYPTEVGLYVKKENE